MSIFFELLTRRTISERVSVILNFNFFSCGDDAFIIESEVYNSADLTNSNRVRESFKITNLLFFLNENVYGKWQPSFELKQKIVQYNLNRSRDRRKIQEGKDY